MKSRLLVLAAAVLAVPSGCGQASGAATHRIVLTGSSTVAPLLLEIGKRFEALHPGMRIDVQTGGSARGIADARRGLADIGMVSRRLRPEESDLRPFLVALDGIALIVHGDNPVTGLSADQVRAVYRGEIRDWSTLDAPAGPITVVHKAAGRSTHELFLLHYGLLAEEVKASIVIGDNEHGIKSVAGDPNAVGYVSIGAAVAASENGVPIRLLPMDGVAASAAHVQDGTYPLTRELNLVTRTEPTGRLRQFLDFARGPEVQELVTELHFVSPAIR